MARRKKNNKASIGCLFWIALILLVLVIFLFNRETIQNVLDETGFLDIIQKEKDITPPDVKQTKTPEEQSQKPEKDIVAAPPENIVETPVKPAESASEPEKTVVAVDVVPEKAVPETETGDKPAPDQKVRRSKMYFVEVLDDGSIQMKSIVRPVYYVDSPLTETMKTLLEGLSGSELNMGLITLIPEQTTLLSISVKNGIAYINFSDSFRFNSFGAEGYTAQLKQVVFTATEFNNVNAVQILIEGALNEYMGPEGSFIGEPLSRDDF